MKRKSFDHLLMNDDGMESIQSVVILAVAALILTGMQQLWSPGSGKGIRGKAEDVVLAAITGEKLDGGADTSLPSGSGGGNPPETPEPEDPSDSPEFEVLVWQPSDEILYDSQGNVIATRDIGLESPLYDPIDFVLDVASLGTASAVREVLATAGVSITNAVLRHIDNISSTDGVITIEVRKPENSE